MIDFTLKAYQNYLVLIKEKYDRILRFDEFFENGRKLNSFCLIRHDVDRRVDNALAVAQLEHQLGIKSTFYFRNRPSIFKPDIIKQVAALGHEVGYHYENLSDAGGDLESAMSDFKSNLEQFRRIAEIRTISMHGSALKGIDNRDLWKPDENQNRLRDEFNILGEVYLNIDYSDICYINDTGRNWTTTKANVRDRVQSNINASFSSGKELLNYLGGHPHPKMVFQIHPERVSPTGVDLILDWSRDQAINSAKVIFNLGRKSNVK